MQNKITSKPTRETKNNECKIVWLKPVSEHMNNSTSEYLAFNILLFK